MFLNPVFTSPIAGHQLADAIGPDLAAIDAYIGAQMDELRIPGLSLGIVHDGAIIYLHGYGVADPSGRPVTPQTPFILGSTTKSFTALAIMQLVEGGKIDLNASVRTYLSWFRVADVGASSQITVRHLLNHMSGLSTWTGRENSANGDTGDGALEANVRRLSNVELDRPVGTSYEYSNSNYDVLGMIVQAVSGQSYESYVREHIFEPLEMRHSYASQSDAVMGGMATGYQMWFGFPFPANPPYVRSMISSGYLISCAEDMAHYLIAQNEGGRFDDAEVLSPEGIAELHRPVAQMGGSWGYGMGWAIGPTDGVQTILHDGSTPNFGSSLLIVPDERLGIAILINAMEYGGSVRFSGIARGVMNILLGRQPPAIESEPIVTTMIIGGSITAAILVAQAIWSISLFHHRRRVAMQRARSLKLRLAASIILLALDIALSLFFLTGLPRLLQSPLAVMMLYVPDVTSVIVIFVALALSLGAIDVIQTIGFLRQEVQT